MPTFDELMSYSKARTTKSEGLAAELLAKRKEEEARRAKQQAEADKREREMQEKLRKRHFEDLQKQEQRKRDQERARAAREAEAKRREDEARDKLVKGRVPGQGASRTRWPSNDGGDGSGVRRRGIDEDDGDSSMALTRQEKRERKLQASLNRTYGNMNGRSKTTGGYVRSGRKLPGGAVDRLSNGGSTDSANVRSAKERLAQMPNELRKLNTVKRDTRTIDEILQDRARAKDGQVLEGEKAKEFNDWFTPAKRSSTPSSQSKTTSGPPKNPKSAVLAAKSLPTKSSYPSFSKSSTSKPSKASAPPIKPAKKRPRSATPPEDDHDDLFSDEDDYDDDDDLPPPPSFKRRAVDAGASSLGDTIWSLFGKSRSTYVGRDVLSDDEDMEADSRALEAEERRSALQAKKEDLEALEEERRHEEEKRRRKKLMAARN